MLAIVPVVNAEIIYKEAIATGRGGDIPEATQDALEVAIGQVTGQKISSSISLEISESTKDGEYKSSEQFQQKIEKITRGIVKSYKVLDSGVVPGSNRAYVKLKAIIPTYKKSEQLKRMKLAVTPISISNSLASDREATTFAEAISSSLEAYLTQTRKFAILDRRNIAIQGQELKRISSMEAPIEETLKIGMRVGADLIVLAKLKSFHIEKTNEKRVSGRLAEVTRVPVNIDIRVIDFATGQIKFANTYINSGKLFGNYNVTQYSKDIGNDIGQLISDAIFPIAVVSSNGVDVTLNQGGDTVKVGRKYKLVKLGEKLVDPYTKESLGNSESEVAVVEIYAVTDRVSNGKIIQGKLPERITQSSILARLQPDGSVLVNLRKLELPKPLLDAHSSSSSTIETNNEEQW
jgi:curli biogenesis system outer membrane secretion channel CsgG